MKKVFYVSYGGGHANISRFIYKELEKDPQVEQEVLALTMADKVFDFSNVPYKHLSEYLPFFPEDERSEILSLGEEIAKSAHNPDTTMKYEETVAYMGCGMWDLIQRYGREKAQKMFDENQRKAFCPITVMRRIFDIVQPDCVVITCEVRMELAAAAVANERGIPVVRVSDCHWIHPIEYDCITCVMNETAREYAINEVGIDPDSIRVTGHPVFENNAKYDANKVDSAKRELDISGKKTILVLPPVTPINHITDWIYRLMDEFSDFMFIVKPHPNQDRGIYPENRVNMRLVYDYDISVLFHSIDLVLMTISTAGIEAAFADKNVISIENDGFDICPMWDLSRFGIAHKTYSYDEIKQSIFDCLDEGSKISKELKAGRETFKNKEHAARNIADIIIAEIDKRKEKYA